MNQHQQSSSVIIESPHQLDIPTIDIASYVLSSGTPISRRSAQYFDAKNPSKCFSLDQAKLYVKQFAHGLQKLLKPGEKVLLYSGNRLYFPILLWGTTAAGCVFTAISPSASKTELEYQLRDSEAKILITSPQNLDVTLKASSAIGLDKSKVYLFADLGEDISNDVVKSWFSIWSPVQDVTHWEWKKINTLEEAQSTTAIINYSSGTTGVPKGVEISHYNAVSNSMQLVHKLRLVGNTTKGRNRKSRLENSEERWLAALPMYHAYGQTYFCMNAARIGAKIFIMPKYNVKDFLQYLDIYRITFLTAVPVILTTLSKQSNPEIYNLKSIENVVTGSAPLNHDIAQKIERMYLKSGVKVKQGLGMTECTCSVAGFTPDDEDDGRSVGWLNANCSAKVVPVEDRDFSQSIPPGNTNVVGEFWFSGPNVMKGYYSKPSETAKSIVFEDGRRWLRTGDIGYIDNRGRIYIVDRLKDLIKVKGLQVAPAELELALQTHPNVADAAVIGAKINGYEYPRAFVVRKNNSVTSEELIDLIKSRFAPHKQLTGGVYFINEIPRTPSGKIIRRSLPQINQSGSKSKI